MREQQVSSSFIIKNEPISVGSTVTKAFVENETVTYRGFFVVQHITFTGMEDVATIQNVLTKQVQCVDVQFLKKIHADAVDVPSAPEGNVIPFKKH